MLILLPPSETKAAGGDGPPLDLDRLSYPELTRARKRTVAAVVRLGKRPQMAREVLGLGKGQRDEITRNAELKHSPTMPAIERYTGVLYDALDAGSLRGAERARAYERLAVGSALFGLVRASDPIPAYRLSGSTRLPEFGGSLGAHWKPALGSVLRSAGEVGLIVDLRSGMYQALAPAPGAVTVRVLNEAADGSRSVVSHFNKSTKGLVARVLATAEQPAASLNDIVELLRARDFEVELVSATELDVILRG